MLSTRIFAAASLVAAAWAQTTGGQLCSNDRLCIKSTVNSTTTRYELTFTGGGTVGWLGMGFGTSMPQSPMVIMWHNNDGSVTLSQRIATDYSMPLPIQDSPRVATLDSTSTDALAAQPKFAFTLPTDPDSSKEQQLIWAVGRTNPGSSSSDAELQEHAPGFYGIVTLDASTVIPDSSSGSGSGNGTGTGTGSSGSDDLPIQDAKLPPLSDAQRIIAAHAVIFAIGFLVLLPSGALFARLLRTVTPQWFKVHWIIQFGLTAPVLFIALVLGLAGVSKKGSGHFKDRHSVLGIILCGLYILQCSLGAFVHFVKDPNRTRRPLQNYFHAIVGIAIIAIALVQVRIGYSTAWPRWTGRNDIPSGVNTLWVVWCILLPLLYFGGLALLPRQYRMEAEEREAREQRAFAMRKRSIRPMQERD